MAMFPRPSFTLPPFMCFPSLMHQTFLVAPIPESLISIGSGDPGGHRQYHAERYEAEY